MDDVGTACLYLTVAASKAIPFRVGTWGSPSTTARRVALPLPQHAPTTAETAILRSAGFYRSAAEDAIGGCVGVPVGIKRRCRGACTEGGHRQTGGAGLALFCLQAFTGMWDKQSAMFVLVVDQGNVGQCSALYLKRAGEGRGCVRKHRNAAWTASGQPEKAPRPGPRRCALCQLWRRPRYARLARIQRYRNERLNILYQISQRRRRNAGKANWPLSITQCWASLGWS